MMKNTVRVSISGIAFAFEEDAYKVMNDYLKKLEAGYAKNPDGREIIADIEARIAELVLEHQESDAVIGVELARSIVSQLGFPDDMDSGEDIPVEEFPRRLYRNPDGAKLGGVCSGIGTYFRIDPVWIRLAIFAPLLLSIFSGIFHWGHLMGSAFGMFVLLYFILWMAIPMARTPRQKLEMRGEKITASSIKQSFEDDASAISDSPKSRESASVWANIVYVLGRILQVFIKVIAIFIAFIFGIVAISILIALVAVLVTGDVVLSGVTLGMFSGLEGISPAAYTVLLLLVVLIPILVLAYYLIKVLFGSRTSKPFLATSGVVWLIVVVFTIVITARNADTLRYEVRNFVEHVDDYDWDEMEDRIERRVERREKNYNFGSGSERILRVDGGPTIVERSGGKTRIVIEEEKADSVSGPATHDAANDADMPQETL